MGTKRQRKQQAATGGKADKTRRAAKVRRSADIGAPENQPAGEAGPLLQEPPPEVKAEVDRYKRITRALAPLTARPERSPGAHTPKTLAEVARRARLLRTVAPHIRMPKCDPEPAAVGKLMDYLNLFWGGDHEAEMWELYKRFTRYADADAGAIEEEARRGGLGVREYVYRTALEHIRAYVQKRPPLAAIAGRLRPVSAAVIVATFVVSKATLRREVKAHKLLDYRPTGSPKNAEMMLDPVAVARLHPPQKRD